MKLLLIEKKHNVKPDKSHLFLPSWLDIGQYS
jgi:hypothetical protein